MTKEQEKLDAAYKAAYLQNNYNNYCDDCREDCEEPMPYDEWLAWLELLEQLDITQI